MLKEHSDNPTLIMQLVALLFSIIDEDSEHLKDFRKILDSQFDVDTEVLRQKVAWAEKYEQIECAESITRT